MNNIFFPVVCTLAGAVISGVLTISSPSDQRNLTNILFTFTGVITSTWVGYALGKWHGTKEINRKEVTHLASTDVSTERTLKFAITYPRSNVKSVDDIGGWYRGLSENEEAYVWLYIYDGKIYWPYKIRNIQRVEKQWRVEDISFERLHKRSSQDTYDMQVFLATKESISELRSCEEMDIGLQRLPDNIDHLSERITVKHVFF